VRWNCVSEPRNWVDKRVSGMLGDKGINRPNFVNNLISIWGGGGTKGHVPSPFWFGFFEIYRINSQKWKEEHAPHASVGTEVDGSCQKRLQSDGSSLFHCWLLGNQINVPCLIIWIRVEWSCWRPHLGS
jgi:hypothetical protein